MASPADGGGYQRFSSPAPQPSFDPAVHQQPSQGPAFSNFSQQSPPRQTQQQGQGQFNPFVAGGMPWANDATAQMGMQFGRSAVMAGSDYVERNFLRYLPVTHLQHAFNVSNLYVLRKIRLVLFPWRHVSGFQFQCALNEVLYIDGRNLGVGWSSEARRLVKQRAIDPLVKISTLQIYTYQVSLINNEVCTA